MATPIVAFQPEYLSETETIFVALGPDGAVLSPTNNAAVREAFESAIPGLDILEAAPGSPARRTIEVPFPWSRELHFVRERHSP